VASASRGSSRTRGRVEKLPSGSLRVSVYAGIDPVSKKRNYLVETVPAGTTATRDAERVRTRLLNQLDERRNPRTKATVNQLLDRWLEVAEMETTTRNSVVGRLNRHVRPVLGAMSVGRLDAETLESFYAQLRRCRERCGGGRQAGHTCRPLAPATIRLIHANLSAALSSAVRWRWLAVSPAGQAAKPSVAKSDPQPPSGSEAAGIVLEAWKDPDSTREAVLVMRRSGV
jgi:integrase